MSQASSHIGYNPTDAENERNRDEAARGATARWKSRQTVKALHPATSEIEYSAEEMEFMDAMQEYKKATGHKFPSWSEALRVVRSLGYARPEASAIPA